MARNDFQYFLGAMKCLLEFLLGDRYVQSLDIAYQSKDVIGEDNKKLRWGLVT